MELQLSLAVQTKGVFSDFLPSLSMKTIKQEEIPDVRVTTEMLVKQEYVGF